MGKQLLSLLSEHFLVNRRKLTVMYREKRIYTMKELRDYVYALDEDEGIRIFGRIEDFVKGGFIFVGVYMGRYCVRVCDRVWDRERNTHSIGQKSKYFYFSKIEELFEFLKINIERPINAWLY
jgi:hypothetical protein